LSFSSSARFRKRVEQAQTDGGLEREDEASGRVGRRLVTQLRDRRQVGLERIDEASVAAS
jgi:hypothetical protein